MGTQVGRVKCHKAFDVNPRVLSAGFRRRESRIHSERKENFQPADTRIHAIPSTY